jgi:myo-inositol-1(or 4)-monophosphatase
MNAGERYQFIIKIIKEAGKLILSLREEKFEVSTKNKDPRDFVTSVDLAVNDFLDKKIHSLYPNEVIISEEIKNESTNPDSYWSLDPIDGTSNFMNGIPHFAVCITYVEKGEPTVGAVFNPVTNELFSFQKGKGVFLNDKKIRVSEVTKLSDACTLLHIGRKENLLEWGIGLQRKFVKFAKKTGNLCSSALDLCFLAAGRVDAVVYGTLTTRDIAVALVMVREAGGEIYNLDGKPVALSSEPQTIIATSTRSLFDEISD